MHFSHSHHFAARWVPILLLTVAFYAKAEGPIRAVVVLPPSAETNEQALLTIKGQTGDLAASIRVIFLDDLPKETRGMEQRFRKIGEGADVVFFPDFTDEMRVMLYTSMPKIGTTLIRTIDSQNESLESRFEITAVMIRGIITAMMSGKEIGVHVPEQKEAPLSRAPTLGAAKQQCPKDDASGKTRRSSSKKSEAQNPPSIVSVQDSYGIGWVSEDIPPVHFIRPAVRIYLKALELFVAYRFSLPFRKESSALAADLYPHPIELGFDVSFHKGSVFFRLGASLITDPISVKVTAKQELKSQTKKTVDFRLSVSPFVSMDWFFTRRVYLFASVSADVFIYQTVYDIIREDDSKVEFLNLWKSSPVLQLGFGFNLI